MVYPNQIQLNIIDKYLEELKTNPNTYIKITSHASNEGDWDANLEMSRKRAILIAEYIRKYGVPQDRIILDWLGEDVPMFFGLEDQEKNSRTNIRVIKKVKYYKTTAVASKASKPEEEAIPSPAKEEQAVQVVNVAPKLHTPEVTMKSVVTEKKDASIGRTQATSNTRIIRTPSPRTASILQPEDDLLDRGANILPTKSVIFVDASTRKPLQVEVNMLTKTGKASVSTGSKGEIAIDMNTLKNYSIKII